MAKSSLKIYFVPHHDGHLTGILMRKYELPFEPAAPSAYGATEADVMAQLEQALLVAVHSEGQKIGRYYFDEEFTVRRVSMVTHPMSFVKNQTVIGKRDVPLAVYYAFSRTESGSYRVLLPRFGWLMSLESLELAAESIRVSLTNALLGENARWVYELRAQGEEYVRSWTPDFLTKGGLDVETDPDEFEVLPEVAEDWVARAASRSLAMPLGHAPELDGLVQAVTAEPAPSVLIVGGAGVGKTMLLHRLAYRLLEHKRAGESAIRMWSSSAERILAGMSYLGMWHQRCLELVEDLSWEGDLLRLESLMPIVRPQNDGVSIADMLLPEVETGALAIVSECTEVELEQLRRSAPRLLANFRIVRVAEPPPREVSEALETYLARRKVPIHPTACKRLVGYLGAYERAQRFPGKAFRFAEWLAKRDATGSSQRATIYPAEAADLYSAYAGLPVSIIAEDTPLGAEQIAGDLSAHVIGQDAACAATAEIVARFKAGLNDPDRPVGSLLYVGPTGVGKTQLARRLASYLYGDERRLIRVDMSEYAFPGASRRLLATGSGTSLAARVRKDPLCVVLLDEIEKAHPEAFDLLLGVLGEARLTNADGQLVDFRMAVILMTSNLGVERGGSLGFASGESDASYVGKVRDHFRPEFFNRIDAIVPFRSLQPSDLLGIVRLELDAVRRRWGLRSRGLTLEVSDAAAARLAELGYDPSYGARPLKRVIEERVVGPIAVALAEQPQLSSAAITVRTADEPSAGPLTVLI